MRPRSLLLLQALVGAPMAIFRRRNKDDWLGELDEIRGQALEGSAGEVGQVVSEPEPADSEDRGRPGAVDAVEGTGTPADVASVDQGGPRAASQLDAPPASAAPSSGRVPVPEPDSSPDPVIGPESAQAPEPAAVASPAPATPPPPVPAAEASRPTRRASRAPKPAPNRERPSELWHSPIDLAAVSMAPELALEERLESVDLVERGSFGVEGQTGSSSPAEASSADHPVSASTAASAGPRLGLVDPLEEPQVDVLAARDLQDQPVELGDEPTAWSSLRPPTDIFAIAPSAVPDVAQPSGQAGSLGQAPTDAATDAAGGDGGGSTVGLVGAPVGRSKRHQQRSLFGGGAALARPKEPDQALAITEAGEIVDQRGTIRFAERLRPDVWRSPSDDSLEMASGWCWVARAPAVPPVRITLPNGVLVVPGATRALAVVEVDQSIFISVVKGSAHLEHHTGLIPLAAGSIMHVPLVGDITVDSATAAEMASDAILTRNLRMDEALDAIAGVQQRSSR